MIYLKGAKGSYVATLGKRRLRYVLLVKVKSKDTVKLTKNKTKD